MREIACLIACLMVPGGFRGARAAAAGPPLTPEQATAAALLHHPALRQRKELREAAAALVREAEGSYLPHVSLEAIDKDGPPGAPSFGFSGLVNSTITHRTGADLVLSQLITDSGRTSHTVEARRLSEAATAQDEEARREEVLINVYRSYYDALAAQGQQRLAAEDTAARKTTARAAQARFDAGLSSRVDADLARASLAQAQAQLARAGNDVLQAFANLNAAMGVNGPSAYTLQDLPGSPSPAASLPAEPELSRMVENRPENRSLDAQIRSANETARAVEAGRLPVLRALASVGYDNVAPGTRVNHTYAVAVGVSFPFFSGGQVEAAASAQRHRAAALRAEQDDLQQNLRLQIIRAELNLSSLQQQQLAIREELTQAQDSASLATQRYEAGLGNILELQQAQLALLNARTEANRLRYQSTEAEAEFHLVTSALAPAPQGK